MLEGRRALDLALDLTRMPMLGAAMRARPLPPDALVVIRIAAGCKETLREATSVTGAPPETIREAAVLYLQKVLFASDSDSHRVLGVLPGAARSQMREHMRWLLKWLHPDRNPDEWESVFAERVIKAWREAGANSDQPSGRDEKQGALAPTHKSGRRQREQPVQRWVALPLRQSRTREKRRRIAAAILVGALGLAISSVPVIAPISKWFAQEKVEAESSAQVAE